MGLRKGAVYRAIKRPFTRKSRVKSKAYIKTVPPMHTVKFVMGNSRKFFENKYPFVARIICDRTQQVRDVALEATRRQMHREIELQVGLDYYMNVSVYPHHILRENKMLTGAGADRMSQGMSHSFGSNIGKAAQVTQGQAIFTIALPTEDAVNKARAIYHTTKQKLPCPSHMEVEKIIIKGEKQL